MGEAELSTTKEYRGVVISPQPKERERRPRSCALNALRYQARSMSAEVDLYDVSENFNIHLTPTKETIMVPL